MNKNFLRRCCAFAAFSVVCFSKINLCDSAVRGAFFRENVFKGKYTHTQKSVSDNNSESAYSGFLRCGKKRFVIPGLDEGFVPQGISFFEKENSFLISGYNSENGNAYILSVNAATGKMNGEYRILNKDGTEYKGHSGGVVCYGKYIYLTDGYFLYYINSGAFSGGSKDVPLKGKIILPMSASFITAHDGYLWAGNFYHKSYGNKFDITARDGYNKKYHTFIVGYRFDAKEEGALRTSIENGAKKAKPYLAFAAPNEVQGIAFLSNGDVHLSCSYGRKVMSAQLLYKNPFKEPCDGEICVENREIPVWFLNNERIKRAVFAPPMSEGAVYKNGKVYVVFESAAVKYRADAVHPTDCVWTVDWSKK